LKYLYKILFLAILCGCLNITHAQFIESWTARLNGLIDSVDAASAVTTDNAGNVYVTGYSQGALVFTDYMTVKYSPDGVQLWSARYNGPAGLYDEARAIVVDDSGNVYVTGFSWGLLSQADYVTIKYNSSGVQQWAARYDGALSEDIARSIAIDNSGNVYITGSSRSSLLPGSEDYLTIKYNSAGTQQWTSRYNGPGSNEDKAYAIVVDNNGNSYVTGSSRSSGTPGSEDYATVKYNSSGSQQWVSRYNGPGGGQDKAYAIVVDNNGNSYVTGESEGQGTGSDYATVKYDQNGNQQWDARYNGSGNDTDKAYAIVVDNNGNSFVTGESKGSSSGSDYATVKYNSSGTQQWASRYNGPGNNEDKAYAIIVDNSGNSYVTGSSRNGGMQESSDYATVKYNSTGVQQWDARYNGTGNNEDKAYAIIVDNSNNVLVTGSSRNSSLSGSEDFLTIKYEQLTSVKPVNTAVPLYYKLYQNYPNPFNPSTKIKFDIPAKEHVKLVVYDMLGRELSVLVNEILQAGTYETEWNSGRISSGIYFVKLVSGSYMNNIKMILIK
jgi:uncharacterized delta-60 repeat protein